MLVLYPGANLKKFLIKFKQKIFFQTKDFMFTGTGAYVVLNSSCFHRPWYTFMEHEAKSQKEHRN